MTRILHLSRGTCIAALAGALYVTTGTASAAVTGLYAAVDAGPASYDVRHAEADEIAIGSFGAVGLDVIDAVSEFDNSSFGLGFTFGYQFTANWAVEGTYLRLGKARYDATGTLSDGVDQFDLDMGLDMGSSGLAVAMVGSWPLGWAFTLDARAGAYFAKTKFTLSVSDGTSSDSLSDSNTDVAVLLGVGATWSLSDAVGLRLGYNLLKDALGGERDVSQVFLGLRYSYGY